MVVASFINLRLLAMLDKILLRHRIIWIAQRYLARLKNLSAPNADLHSDIYLAGFQLMTWLLLTLKMLGL